MLFCTALVSTISALDSSMVSCADESIVDLTDETFEDFIAAEHVVAVLFYVDEDSLLKVSNIINAAHSLLLSSSENVTIATMEIGNNPVTCGMVSATAPISLMIFDYRRRTEEKVELWFFNGQANGQFFGFSAESLADILSFYSNISALRPELDDYVDFIANTMEITDDHSKIKALVDPVLQRIKEEEKYPNSEMYVEILDHVVTSGGLQFAARAINTYNSAPKTLPDGNMKERIRSIAYSILANEICLRLVSAAMQGAMNNFVYRRPDSSPVKNSKSRSCKEVPKKSNVKFQSEF